MDIVSRLKQFMQQNGISNSQFADTCDIPRPTLSQLLNGRNKKVSDEVIGKIHRAYPSLNILWLMFGDGEMIVGGAADDDEAMADKRAMGTPREPQQRAISFGGGGEEDVKYDNPRKGASRSEASFTATIENIMRQNSHSAGRGNAPVDGRRVVNIMVFYNDGRFESFVPGS